ncbi:hypothetical protein JHD50_10955 [Sulfurimonas sp. MAG313]|nr:hypothetical protein [Sulfurimonas sp. MAG313]MDF1881811.1 hypothetical protein [Sulfurimonas sp. MAG313]
MLYDVLKDREYSNLMQKHIVDILSHLFDRNQNFGMLCKIETISFDPALPEDITSEFRPMTLFFLAGYTFESARLEQNAIIFEAGFGADNLGSIVTVPLLGIMQIIIDETPIFVNLSSPEETQETKAQNNPSQDTGQKSSMEALLANPENKKFLK